MSDEIVFKGIDRSEALRFIAAIRKKAAASGRQRDYGWMADVASGCFEEEAAAWYENLDLEVQQDWTDLSRELLKQWPAEPHGITPGLAAAAPGQGPSGSHPKQVSGVVKVITDRGNTSYLSRILNASSRHTGMMATTDEVDEVVRVTFRWSDAVHDIRFESDFSEYPLLGFHFSSPNIHTYSHSLLWAYLSPYQITSMGSMILSPNVWSSGPPGGHRAAPSRWKVERDGTMRPYVVDDATYKSRELDVMLQFDMETKLVFITQHAPTFLNNPAAYTSAQLIFQPC